MTLALQLDALFQEEKRLQAMVDRNAALIKEKSFQYCEHKGYKARLHRQNLEREVAADAARERGEALPLEMAIATGRAF